MSGPTLDEIKFYGTDLAKALADVNRLRAENERLREVEAKVREYAHEMGFEWVNVDAGRWLRDYVFSREALEEKP